MKAKPTVKFILGMLFWTGVILTVAYFGKVDFAELPMTTRLICLLFGGCGAWFWHFYGENLQ